MRTLTEVASKPSGFDSRANYMGPDLDEYSDLFVVMTRTRDTGDSVSVSNWRTALKQLGGEGEHVVIHRFGHWACGWWEALCVSGPKKQEGEEIEDSLSDYPVLDEEDMSELEMEEEGEAWENYICSDFRLALHDKFDSDEDSSIEERIDSLTDDECYELFHNAMEETDTYFEHGEGVSVDMDRIIEGVTSLTLPDKNQLTLPIE